LRETRERERRRPALDDKIVCAWNGLAVSGLARLAAALEPLGAELEGARETAKREAERAVEFLRREMWDENTGRLKRVHRDGPGETEGFADDYAFLVQGLLDLYEVTWDDGLLEWADKLQKTQIELFWDATHDGFFSTTEQPDLLLRLKDAMDNAEPSANSVSARNLFRLGAMFSDAEYTKLASRTLHAFEAEMLQHPFLFAGMLDSVVAERLGMKSLVIRGSGDRVEKQIRKIREQPMVGRTLIRLGGDAKDSWVRRRSEELKAFDPNKPGIMLCEGALCRELLEEG